MAVYYPKPLARLVGELEKLPGIGPKSAQRLAFYLMRQSDEDRRSLSSAMTEVTQVRFCKICYNYSEGEICAICANDRRDHTLLCVVAEPRDLIAMEKTDEYNGVYHVLHGVISPLEGVGPDKIKLKELEQRVADGHFKEIVVATNPTVEGDTTSLYVAHRLKPFGVRVTRIAHGMPVGGDLDYADQATLIQALEYRREL